MNIGELKIVCKKNVSNIDWCDAAIKNLRLLMIFSLPLSIILVDRKTRRQNEAQYPIALPPSNTIFCGKINVGMKIIEIRIIPEKKKSENKKFLIIESKTKLNL
jgi:hypothetical protein